LFFLREKKKSEEKGTDLFFYHREEVSIEAVKEHMRDEGIETR
jgi:hypothetical protein